MVRRPLKFKLDAYRLYKSGMTPREAFAQASKLNDDVPLSKCMTHRLWSSGYMSDDIKNFLRRKIVNKDVETLEYFRKYKLDTAALV